MSALMKLSKSVLRNVNSYIRVSVRHHNFDGDVFQRTEISMLSKETVDVLYVETYSQLGFRLNNGFRVMGPCVLFPRSVLHWNVMSAGNINENSLSLFPLLEPKLDLLIIGIGDYGAKYDYGIIKFLRSKKLNVEILPTDQACATFNFLNSERRYVAAALIPPTNLHTQYEHELASQTQIERNTLFSYNEKDGGSTPLDMDEADVIVTEAKEKMEEKFPDMLMGLDKNKKNKKD